jgi:hypothetical protein
MEMPKFHFEIADGYVVPDPSGMELPSEQAAREIAHKIAKQISNDIETETFNQVVVRTDDGRVVYIAQIKPRYVGPA